MGRRGWGGRGRRGVGEWGGGGRGLAPELPVRRGNERVVAVGGMGGVAVKGVESIQNTDGEGGVPR